ncbi:GNAT family N-acetyltransferase [Virgibacillus sp. NKC19-3]|uniref:GNAT family N-acetyltransferase n=1 Tax=Virgibacillus saliphilus TaxID=2831674 RepID=UPI001C9ACAD2|nr:GNAT family N-acetyltransferase [Virgibacillus sp. NKC19-3]MBY7144891.1 GNAT family N-acetyltransferase [Virgibacillus sp. NKC19-3]
MLIREIDTSDAETSARLIQQVEASSEYMLWEAGERNISLEQQEKMIASIGKKANSTIFVAENDDNELVGYLMAIGGDANRNKHAVYIVVGVSKGYRGRGVGTRLFEEMEQWAQRQSIHRLALTVVTRNEVGLSLYKRMGFEIEGTKRHSLFINGEFVDEYYMSKLL